MCFSEIQVSEENINKNSTFPLKNYNETHQVILSCKGAKFYTIIIIIIIIIIITINYIISNTTNTYKIYKISEIYKN